jgi:uncharacterized membrane protein
MSATCDAATRWWTTGAALVLLLPASWWLQSGANSWHLMLFPKITMLLPVTANLAVWLPTLTGVAFILLSWRVLLGRFNVTRGTNILLVILAVPLGVDFLEQLIGIRSQAYRISWPTTLISVVAELLVIAAVVLAYLRARRSPTLVSRSCLNWLLSLYVVNVWAGSGITLIGP